MDLRTQCEYLQKNFNKLNNSNQQDLITVIEALKIVQDNIPSLLTSQQSQKRPKIHLYK